MKFLLPLFIFFSLSAFGQPSKLITIPPSGSAVGNAKGISLGFSSSTPPPAVTKIPLPGDVNNAGSYFFFNTDKAYTTSAGVYTPDGNMIRLLWANLPLAAGTNRGYWNGDDDYGHHYDEGNYIIRVLTSNVYYTWEGGIGNTSTVDTGITAFHCYGGFNSVAIAGNAAYYGVNYNEGNTASYRFNRDAIGTKLEILGNNGSNKTNQEPLYVATDSNYVYYAGFDPFAATKHFVYAVKAIADTEITTFAFGVQYQNAQLISRLYKSVIDLITNTNATCTGMAVQKTGGYLFVAHGKLNQLDVLDKLTGQIIQTLTFTNIEGLARDGNDNLWMIYGSPQVVQKFIVNGDGTLTASSPTISSPVQPLAIDISPSNATIAICDGLTSQQLKFYSTIDGSLRRTFGTLGGYRSNSTVADNKFYFTDSIQITNYNGHAFVTYAPDSSLWVGDMGNARAQHLAGNDLSFIERIGWMPSSYSVGVDQNDSTRIFSDFKEFKLDYTKNLDNGTNGSWVLFRNWGQSMWTPYIANKYTRMYSIATLSNGHTYCLMQNSGNSNKWDVIELISGGVMRVTNVTGLSGPISIAKDGSLKSCTSSHTVGQPISFFSQPLTGFDGSNNPIWGAAVTTLTYNSLRKEDPYPGGPSNIRNPNLITASGLQIIWNADEETSNYVNWHLGALVMGTNSKFVWRTQKSTTIENNSFYPTNGDYDIGNNTNFAGGPAGVVGNQIVANYHGEGWKNFQTNKWSHWYADGLPIGFFGVTGNDSMVKVYSQAAPQMSGNELSGYFYKLSDSVGAIIHNDESFHSMVHLWKVHNMNTVSEIMVPIALFTSPKGLTATYLDSIDMNNFSIKTIRRDAQINFDWGAGVPPGTAITSASNFSVRWQGYIVPDFSETYTLYTSATNGVRFWIDSSFMVDQWNNASLNEFSGTIALTAGKKYYIRMETSGGGSVYLKWSSASTAKDFIPQAKLFPYLTAPTSVVDLMEGPWYGVEWAQAQLYGWQRNPPAPDLTNKNTQYWSILTNYRHYQRDFTTDFRLQFVQLNTPSIYTMSRDLGTQNVTTSWEVSGVIDFASDNFNDAAKYGQYMEVLDAGGKILERFFINQPGFTGTTFVTGNTLTIASDAVKANISNVTNYAQPIDIKCSNGNVTIKYGPYAAVTDAIFDGTGNWRQPKTVRVYFFHTSSSTNVPRVIDIQSLNYTSNGFGWMGVLILVSLFICGIKPRKIKPGV